MPPPPPTAPLPPSPPAAAGVARRRGAGADAGAGDASRSGVGGGGGGGGEDEDEEAGACGECRALWARERRAGAGAGAGAGPGAAGGALSVCEVRRAARRGRALLHCRGLVYDATGFVREHPGGEASILGRARRGTCVAVDFEFHSARAQREVWGKLRIGVLRPCEGHPTAGPPASAGCAVA